MRLTPVVAATNLDVYTFWLSLTWPVTLLIQEYRFSDCTVPPDGKETKLPSVDQETFTGVFWILCCAWKCVLVQILSRPVSVISYNFCHSLQGIFSMGHKSYFYDQCLLNSQLTFLIFPSFWLSIKWSYYPN